MDDKLLEQGLQFTERRIRRRKWKSVVSFLASIVVFCTTYALILPAITMSKDTYCGCQEHQHSEECYAAELICDLSQEEPVSHEHTEDCYTKERSVICDIKESAGHTHSEQCKNIEKVLICSETESEGHTHEEACFGEDGTVICEVEERSGHVHTEECYEENISYTCGQEEYEGHTHTNACYKEEKVLKCDKETENKVSHIHKESCYEKHLACEKEEHTHEKICYSDKTADLETKADWEETLPDELSTVWADDVLAIADSQLGYKESTNNFIVDEDDEVKGYTRYGEWYGDPYGHWCAMFVSFCLDYADVDKELMPQDASCQNWIETLSKEEYELYHEAGTYEPVPGDLIFFNWDKYEDSDHVGFVYEIIEATEEHGVQVKTIEGNASNTVKYRTYDIDDESIMGYAQLPENPNEDVKEVVEVKKEKSPTDGVFSLNRNAEEVINEEPLNVIAEEGTEAADSYAPNVTLTGDWNTDMLAIAESQKGKDNSTGKYSEWYNVTFGNATTDWTAQFITYCLHYAGVPQEAIPYYTSGDMNSWINTLKESEFFFETGNGTPMPGDLVIMYEDYNQQTPVVGIVKSLQQNGKAVNGIIATTTIKETGDIWREPVGFIRMPKGELSTEIPNILSATATYKYGTIPEGTELVVKYSDKEDEVRDPLVCNKIKEAEMGVRKNYYLEVYFTSNGEKIDVEDAEIKIDFTPDLVTNAVQVGGNTQAQKWMYYKITNNTSISDWTYKSVSVEPWNTHEVQDITFDYEDVSAFVITSAQNVYTQKSIEFSGGTATMGSYSAVLPEDVKLIVELSDEADETKDALIEEEYSQTDMGIRKNYYLTTYFVRNGKKIDVEVNEKYPINITIDFNPDLDPDKDANSTGGVTWEYRKIISDAEIKAWDNKNAEVNGWDSKLNKLTFAYEGKTTYSLTSLQEVHKTLTAQTDIGIVKATFNEKVLPRDAKLIVNLVTDETKTAAWTDKLEDKYESDENPGYQITSRHYLEVYFESNGERVEPKAGREIDIVAQFTPALDSNSSAYEKSEELTWFVNNISADENQNLAINDLSKENTLVVNDEDDITEFSFKYEKADVFSFTAMQESYTFLNAEKTVDGSKVCIEAVGKTSVLPDGSQMIVEFVENETIEEALKSEHETERYKLPNIQLFTIKFIDEQGDEFTPDANAVDISLVIEPAFSAAFNDGTTTVGKWIMSYISEKEGNITLESPSEEDCVQLNMTEDFALTEVTFLYSPNDYYAILAKMDDPNYKTELTVDSHAELVAAIQNAGTEKTIITIEKSFAVVATEDVPGTIEIGEGKNIVINLNGQTITTSDSTLFNVNGGRLAIEDSKVTEDVIESTVPVQDENGNTILSNVGKTANYEDKTLTYYVTTSKVSNIDNGTTREYLEKHVVNVQGNISGGSVPAIVIETGTVNINSGALTDYTNRAIVQKSGTLNLKGGYICGNSAATVEVIDGLIGWDTEISGGAIYVTGDSRLNLSGTVLAGNSTSERGGAIAVESWNKPVITMTGGVISGNQSTSTENSGHGHGYHFGGGGISLDGNASISMNGGYITNNSVMSEGYFEGGGGIFLAGSSKLTLNSGYVTGNYAAGGGGGIRADFMGEAYTLSHINGGFISSNHAQTAEGGGVSIGWDGIAHVTGGYVTNNITSTSAHWGGGGLFVSNGGKMYIKNALLTENHAGGFGGGVAGCSTGRVFLISDRGSAIWGNNADGKTVTDGSEKAEDKIYGLNNPVFMANGYADYFCALTSTVEGNMIGGGASNWKGSADEVPIAIGKNQSQTASYVMGLTANPSDADKANALAIVKSSNGVYINGNNSNTHGGGVLCNGYLVFGKPGEIDFSTGLEVHGMKTLLDGSEEEIPLKDADGNPIKFKFYIVDANTNTIVSTGSNNLEGDISFSARIPFNKEGRYTYYVYEDQDYNSDGFIMDTSKYRLTVDVGAEKSYLNNDGEDTIIKTQYVIKHIKVEKNNGENDWSIVRDYDVAWANEYEYAPVKLPLTDAATFKNYNLETTKIAVKKKWDGEVPENVTITVGLYRWEIVDGVKTTEEPVLQGDKVTLSAENDWKYEWDKKLPLLSDEKGTSYEYVVIEDKVEGYSPSYTVNNETVLDKTTGKNINIATYTITNKKTETLRYSVDITKISDEKTPDGQNIPLGNAEFEFSLKSSEGAEVLHFLKESDGAYVYCDSNTDGATTTLITNNRGKLILKNLPAGTYVLEETKAPSGYLIAESKEFMLGEESEKTTLTYTIVDKRDQSGFELPETGGPGTNVYTAGGILLLMISVLLYIKRKNQMKGGLDSTRS